MCAPSLEAVVGALMGFVINVVETIMCPATFIFCVKRDEIRMIKSAGFVSYVDSLPEECI